jgi:hypothetical protein
MKLSDKEVEVLVMTINPTVERYREVIVNGGNANDMERYIVLQEIQERLEAWYKQSKELT